MEWCGATGRVSEGLNLIGLKRKGLTRERIHALRAGFRFIFNNTGHLYERAREAAERWKDIPEMGEITAFILEEAKRPDLHRAEARRERR
jgi:UDP-N-acetylglucosamine acyltransferase